MTIEIVISSAIVSALIAVIGNMITAKMARTTAKQTAQETASHEIEKMERTWEREDDLSSDDEYGEMVKLVVLYTSGTTVGPYDALASIAALRIKESGDIAEDLDLLYLAVKKMDIDSIDHVLDELIEARRKFKDQR